MTVSPTSTTGRNNPQDPFPSHHPLPHAVPTRTTTHHRHTKTTVTAIGVGEFVEASFASFERTYGAPFARVDDDDDEEDEEEDSIMGVSVSTLLLWLPWSSLLSSMVPIMFLWTRRSMFGVASLLRSFLIGHALRLILTLMTTVTVPSPVRDRLSAWLLHVALFFGGPFGVEKGSQPSSLQQLQQAVLGRMDPNSCPPPALTLLALLTMFAFVVHPDGLTWVLLGKLRDGIQYIFRSSTLCLSMIKDGTMPTLAASGSLAGLIAIAGVIRRAMRPPTESTRCGRKGRDSNLHNGSRGKHKGRRSGRRGHHGHSGNNHGRPGRSHCRIKSGTTEQTVAKSRSLSPSRKAEQHEPSISLPEKEPRSNEPKPKSQGDDRLDGTDSVCPGRKMSSTSIEVGQDDNSEVASCSSVSSPLTTTTTCPLPSNNNNNMSNSNNNKHNSSNIIDMNNMNTTTPSSKALDKKNGRHNKNYHRGRGHARRRRTGTSTSVATGTGSSNKKKETTVATDAAKCSTGVLGNIVSRLRSLSPARSPPNVEEVNKKEADDKESSGYRSYTSSSYFSASSSTSQKKEAQRQPLSPSVRDLEVAGVTPSPPSSPSFSTPPSNPVDVSRMEPPNDYLQSPPSSITPPPISPPFRALNPGYNGDPPTPSYFSSSENSYNRAPSYELMTSECPYTPAKIELASFLTQVGLISSIIACLMRDLADINALYSFTDQDYDRYHIHPETRFHIHSLLQARQLAQAQKRHHHPPIPQWGNHHPAVIRPPPGLGYDANRAASAGASRYAIPERQYVPNYMVESGMCLRGPNPTQMTNNHPNPAPSSTAVPVRHHQSIMTNNEHVMEDTLNAEDDGNIDADLLAQVGGQMAVSILDF